MTSPEPFDRWNVCGDRTARLQLFRFSFFFAAPELRDFYEWQPE
jgi:hypothetical protein